MQISKIHPTRSLLLSVILPALLLLVPAVSAEKKGPFPGADGAGNQSPFDESSAALYSAAQFLATPLYSPFQNTAASLSSPALISSLIPDNPSLTSTAAHQSPGYALNISGNPAPKVPAPDMRLFPVLPGPRYVSLQDVSNNGWSSGLMRGISESPGYAFLASAVIPGLGQAANRQWWKTALFVTAEATLLGIYIHRENRGRDGERYYEKFGNEHWSVVKYARYIAEIHEPNRHDYDFYDLLTEHGQEVYEQNDGVVEPSFDIGVDWPIIDIDALRDAERNSLHSNGNAFSHDLPDYGSQQYYELMSKYYQFSPGWSDWNSNIHDPESNVASEHFLYHAQIGFDFNNDLGVARNMLTALVVNHFVAAFDAYFTQKLRSARMQPSASLEYGSYGVHPTIGFHYRF